MAFRMERINKELQREIALLLEFELEDDILHEAIITAVECTKDLEYAKVWFTTLDPARKKAVGTALEGVAKRLRKLMGERMRLRTTPQLNFIPDKSSEYGRRIDRILEDLSKTVLLEEENP
jgi:ribosome-binding factor A